MAIVKLTIIVVTSRHSGNVLGMQRSKERDGKHEKKEVTSRKSGKVKEKIMKERQDDFDVKKEKNGKMVCERKKKKKDMNNYMRNI